MMVINGYKIEPNADLGDVDLRGVNLEGVNLEGANLSGANLKGANLKGVNLRRANLRGADLGGADLRSANLIGADLRSANLMDANLIGTNLMDTDLRSANLIGADLRGADLTNIRYDAHTIGIHPAPEGDLIGYKKCLHNKIVKLLIESDVKRSCATSRNHRTESALVLAINNRHGNSIKQASSLRDSTFVYTVGETVCADSFDENRWNECGHGIHFFLTREEAEEW